MPIGIKTIAPFAHFESIEFALNITADTIQIIPIMPLVNTTITLGNLGKFLVVMYFKQNPITIGNKIIKKGYISNFIYKNVKPILLFKPISNILIKVES